MASSYPPAKMILLDYGTYVLVTRLVDSAVIRVCQILPSTLLRAAHNLTSITGTVKCMQVDDSTCLTGGVDSTIRMWDLRLVGEETEHGTLGDIPEIVNYSDALSEGGSSKIRDGSVGGAPEDIRLEDGACVRVLEGHSKAVSALYFEDTCLVCGLCRDVLLSSSFIAHFRFLVPPIRHSGNGIYPLVNASSPWTYSGPSHIHHPYTPHTPTSPRASM